jgi:hypothetical protein
MTANCIGVVHLGQMGITVAVSARNGENEVFWASAGRSETTRKRTMDAGRRP